LPSRRSVPSSPVCATTRASRRDRDRGQRVSTVDRDNTRTEAARGCNPGAHGADVTRQLCGTTGKTQAEFNDASTIRALSLRIFDRSFAVDLRAGVGRDRIGLVGNRGKLSRPRRSRASANSACCAIWARRAADPGDVALEAVLLSWRRLRSDWRRPAIAWILVGDRQPQSFHWTMDLALPPRTLDR